MQLNERVINIAGKLRLVAVRLMWPKITKFDGQKMY